MKALLTKALALWAWVWSWVVWAKDKAVAFVRNFHAYVSEPPRAHIKYWVVFTLVVAVGGAWCGGAVVGWFDRTVLGPLHTAFAPVAQPSIERLIPDAVFPSDVPRKVVVDAPKPAPKKEWPDLETLKPATTPPAAVVTKEVAAVPAAPAKKAYVAKTKKHPAGPSVYGSAF